MISQAKPHELIDGIIEKTISGLVDKHTQPSIHTTMQSQQVKQATRYWKSEESRNYGKSDVENL